MKFLLEINPLEVKSHDAGGCFRGDTPRHPGKSSAFLEAIGDLIFTGLRVCRVDVHDCSKLTSGKLTRVGDLSFSSISVGTA